MAKISAKLLNTLVDLQQLLLESVNEAKLSEYSLLERFGETFDWLISNTIYGKACTLLRDSSDDRVIVVFGYGRSLSYSKQ